MMGFCFRNVRVLAALTDFFLKKRAHTMAIEGLSNNAVSEWEKTTSVPLTHLTKILVVTHICNISYRKIYLGTLC